MRDYHDLCLSLEVILLPNVFEICLKTGIADYGLDPAHPSRTHFRRLSQIHGQELNLFMDEKFIFIENAIRGGVRVVNSMYARAYDQQVPDYENTSPLFLNALGPE